MPELIAILVIAVFAFVGARRGLLRQLLTALLIVAAFVSASALAAHVRPLAVKVTGLPDASAHAVAWATVWFLTLVVGGIGIAAGREWLVERGAGGPTGRTVGGVLGAAQGAFLIVAATYVMLAWPAGDETPAGPSLRRETPGPVTTQPEARRWLETVTDSQAARWAVRGGGLLRPVVPGWIQTKMDAVEARVR